MKWIDATHLRNWAQRRSCQDQLPLLIRKLIRASTDSIKSISFPAGENVLIGGWDGKLEVYDASQYLPLGVSLWEFGAGNDIKGKADGDYEKRKLKPEVSDPSKVSFIFVTPRLWTKKADWVDQRKAEGFWGDVVVYDATDLEEWIETVPTVGAWLAMGQLSIFPEGVLSADDFWEEWSVGKKVVLQPAVVLAGRKKEMDQLVGQSRQAGIITVQASSREEAIAFIAATFKSRDDISEDFFSKAILVEDAVSFREAILINTPTYLIVRFEGDDVINRAVNRGHVVFVPIGIENNGQWADAVKLPPLEREAFLSALELSGIERTEAEKISKRSARNIAVLRRQLEFNRSIPEWARGENVRDLIPALLAGRWDGNKEDDVRIIESLAAEPYEVYLAKLKRWSHTADAPIVHIGSKWRLTSPMDAWTYAGRFVTEIEFGKLKSVFMEVHGGTNPKFDLEPSERHRASWYGVKPPFSSWLKEGLVQSLILTSVYGDKIALDLPNTADLWVDRIIYDLLDTSDASKWKTFNHDMPMIAEASPPSFLSSVENQLALDDGPIHQLFEEEAGFIHSNAYHTGMLWALENLAWMPEYFTRAILVLAKLAAIDPGGNLANRPINTLKDIFRSWFPQTLASVEDRAEALRVMAKYQLPVARRVLYCMLPGGRQVANYTHRMRYRMAEERIVDGETYENMFKMQSLAVAILMDVFDKTDTVFRELLERSVELNYNDRNNVLDFLEAELKDTPREDNSTWESLRKIISKHRTFKDTDWSLPEEILVRYQKIYEKLMPSDPIEQRLWLLKENWPDSLNGNSNRRNHQERAKELHEERVSVVKFIHKNYGTEKIFELLDELPLEQMQPIGHACGEVIKKPGELLKVYRLLETDGKRKDFAQHLVRKQLFTKGKDFIYELFLKLQKKKFTAFALTNLLLRVNADKKLWNFIDQHADNEVVQGYWENLERVYFYVPEEDTAEAIERLMGLGRYAMSIHLASYAVEKLETSLLAKVLMGFVTHPIQQKDYWESYEIEHIFEEIRKRNDVEQYMLIRLEWLYLPLLSRSFGEGNTPTLHREMSTNPEFFVMVLEQLYRPASDDLEQSILGEEEKLQKVAMAKHAYQLLSTWYIVPGTDEKTGDLDLQKLRGWVDEVRTRASKVDRLEAADRKIGYILAKYPEPNTKMDAAKPVDWPPDGICQLIEEIGTDVLFDEFNVSTHNKRSSSSRGAFDGGDREWHISKYFNLLAEGKAVKYPRVANELANLANNFRQRAIEEDDRAARDRLEY